MKFPIMAYIGPGVKIAGRWDDVCRYKSEQPRYISSWGRADSIYRWIGCIVRLKQRYWKNGAPAPYGIVIEVGQASWLVALWADGHNPREHAWGLEMDSWHFAGLHDLKQKILARQVSEAELLAFVRNLDESIFIPAR